MALLSSSRAFISSWRRRFSCSLRNRALLFRCRTMDTATSISRISRNTDKTSSIRRMASTIFTVPEATYSAGIRNSSRVSYPPREARQYK